jgi:PAS domain S-box-containing protein
MEEIVKILVVDDDEVDRMAVRHALKAAGVQMELSEADDCAKAIVALQQQCFDCVFLDYRLPDGDGLSLVQQVRSLEIKVPLIVLIGQGDEQIAVQVLKAGACDYISKSKITPDNLFQVLRQTLRIHRAEMEAARANQKLKESEERYRLALEASNDGIWDWYCATDEVYCNDRLLEIIGRRRDEFSFTPAAFTELMHPEDLPKIRAVIAAHLIHAEKCEAEFRIRHSSGEYRYCLARGKAVRDDQGCPLRMSGVLSDLSESKRSDAEIVKLNRDLERRVSELQTLLDVIPIGIAIAQDPECRRIRVNPSLAKLLELPPDANASKSAPSQEKPLYKVYSNGREVQVIDLPMQYAAAKGVEVLDTELDVVVHENKPRLKLLGNAAPLFDEQGKSRGSIGAFLDITERKLVEEQERFLAEASALLAASLDYQTTLENLAHLVVSQLADWCTIHVVEEDQSLRQVILVHANPLKVKWAQKWQSCYPFDEPNACYGPPKVLRSGQSEFYPEIPDFLLVAAARDAEHLQILRQLGLKSALCVPIKARGRTLGTITFVSAESGRLFTQADLALAEDLGRRAALAVDNARLYREATDVGENLRQAIIILGEQQQQLRALQRITNLLNQRLTNLPGLLQVMVRAVCDGIGGAEFAMILLHDPKSNQLELTATAGIGRKRLLLTEFFEPQAGLLAQVFFTGKSQLFQRSRGAEESVDISPHHPITPDSPASIYAVAIASVPAGRLGVLAIGNWAHPDAFDVEDQNLLAAVGEQAAIAINNARMIKALEEREERLAIQNETLARQNRELELTRQQIERQNLQLIEAARLKSQFLAIMSHELRTPMNAVIGFAQVLLRQRTATLGVQQVDMVQRILNNGKNLLALINDILDLSKIEAGHLKLNPEEFNLTALVLTTVAELRPLAEQKQLAVKVYANLDNPIVVNDSVRLRQILVNLLSNAIKFTEAGSVEVRVLESPTQLVLSVKDNGIGIAEADIEHIFEEFRQIDQTTTRKHGGTGLGLAITKSLVHMMQGKITVESKLAQGSTFRVELPRYIRE